MKNLFFVSVMVFITTSSFSQGNSGGNASSNNNANGTALKWDRQGNSVDTSDFIGTTNERALKIKTNNEQRLVITPDGRLGVGIWNPLEKFDVLGTIRTREDLKVDGNFYVG